MFCIPKGVLFDIGNCLVASTSIREQSATEAAIELERAGRINDAHSFTESYLEMDRSYHELHMNHLYGDRRVIRRVIEGAGVAAGEVVEGIFLSEYRSSVRKRIVPDPKLVDLVSHLVDRGHLVGVVSDGTSEEQLETLWRLGILNMLAACVISEDIGVEKPDPKIFWTALDRIHVNPTDAMMVGDSEERDVLGARAIGMRTALVTGFISPPQESIESAADLVVESVLNLAELPSSH